MLDELAERFAEWELGLLPPESVPALALDGLERGCDCPEVAVLAGLNKPLRSEVEDEVVELSRRTGLSRPTHDEAIKAVADSILARIVSSSVPAFPGARQLWQLANIAEFGGPLWKQLSIFVGLASEWEDHESYRPNYEAQIVTEARKLLGSGGLELPPLENPSRSE